MNTQILSKERSIFPSLFIGSSTSDNRNQDDGSSVDTEGKVKNRLMSMWNNMKFGMKIKSNFSKESPVWLLGKCYRRLESPSSDITELGTDVAAFHISSHEITDDESLESFKKDYISKIWLTYRREFPILNGSNYSSDCGWGCMLRSGQMLIAQALVCHLLGREWRWDPEKQPTSGEEFVDLVKHRKIVKWFGDKASKNSPLSLHTLVKLGEALGKKAGDWYAPGFVAHLFREAVKLASKENYEFDSLNVSVAQNNTVYIEDVLKDCLGSNGSWKSLILLIPVRLGVEKFNSIYAPCLTSLFSLKQCIGIIGGRPKHSMYFVGFQDEYLIHLDPHYCQEVVDVWSPDFPLTSFHCKSPRKIHISKMDPSCCIGFFCPTKHDFFSLIETAQLLAIPPKKSNLSSQYPIFVFADGLSDDSRFSPKKLPPRDFEYSLSSTDTEDTEDFEVI